jgi:hypothetical protein
MSRSRAFTLLALLAVSLMLVVLPAATSAQETAVVEDFATETLGSAPTTFSTPIGFWSIGTDGVDTKPVLFEDGTQWAGSQTATSLATQAQALYGDRWHQFTDELPGTAYFPIAISKSVPNFTQGTIITRAAIVGGDIDQEIGIVFNYQPNGDYMALRLDADEGAMKLYQWVQGQPTALKIVENVPAALARWHDLQVTVSTGGTHVAGSLDGAQFLDVDITTPIAGQVGVWSKTDSVAVFNSFSVDPNAQ